MHLSGAVRRSLLLLAPLWLATAAHAQNQGIPDKFDFYLLNVAWGPEFCSIKDTSSQCKTPDRFVVHGLWPQNNDGSYPVTCAERHGPQRPQDSLDITPDRALLDHEWAKHGTCTNLRPEEFFALEHKAFHALTIPPLFTRLDHELTLKPADLLALFSRANPRFLGDSILLSCSDHRLTAIEACFSKDRLKPIACRGLQTCQAETIRVAPAIGRRQELIR